MRPGPPTSPCPEPGGNTEGGNSLTMTRRVAVVPLALTAALALAGCGGTDNQEAAAGTDEIMEPASEPADPAEDETVMEADAGVHGTVTNLDTQWQSVPESEDHYLLAPGLELRITEIAEPKSLDAATYEQLGGRIEEGIETVVPAAGETFLAATYSSTDPQLPVGGENPETTALLRVEGSEVTSVFSGSGERQQDTIVVAVPEEAEPEDVVLQTSTSGRGTDPALQSISLMDGTRVETDIPHAYLIPAWDGVEVSDAGTMDVPSERLSGAEESIRGSVDTAYLTPMHPDHGWPRTDDLYLVIDVDEPKNHDNHSII